ncbi:MAG: ATP-dependent sacrificial sulfur transferase LarE [Eubacterium sp.]|nr:ATP-dependent sacrificial sulfur transferase LarE [Eubacterium sp.]
MKQISAKYEELKSALKKLGQVAVAYSGGVDSTFLLYAAKEVLGERVIAVTASSSLMTKEEILQTKEYCKKLGVRQLVVEINPLAVEGFSQNPKNRCYLCKHAIFQRMLKEVKKAGDYRLVEGSNMDDDADYRPGAVAIKELGIGSPLHDAGLLKEEIRKLSKEHKIPTWNKPSMACLASRFAYGEEITTQKLQMVGSAESFLRELGFTQLRVRMHGTIARIELISDEFTKFMWEDTRMRVYKKLKELGFSYVALDLIGYRMGSMNE